MKTRLEIEELLSRTLAQQENAEATRIIIDILLDIRELLQWEHDKELQEMITKEREEIQKRRMMS